MAAQTSLVGVTLAGNSAGKTAGGIYGGAGSVYNSIIAGNSATFNPDAQGAFTSLGNNLIGYIGSSIGWVSSDLKNVADPGLGTLHDNGGATQTIALLPGSPALAAGNIASAPTTDQRGFQRIINNQIDIGAFENQSQLFTLTPPASNPNPDIGIAASFNLGSFAESDSSTSWTVTVNWGDGTANTVFSTTSQGSLGNQSHTYATNANSPYTVTVTVSDADSNFDQMTFSVSVNPPIVVNPTSPTGLNIGTLGNGYSQQLSASGGSGSYTFSTSSALDGLTLSTPGLLSGNPTAAGSFSITVTATDSDGGTGSQTYTLVINPAIVVSPTTMTGLAIATIGNQYDQSITASGGAGSPYTFTTADPPDGLSLSKAGLLNGSPMSSGTFTFTVTATDGNGGTGSQDYSLTVNPPIVVSPTSPTGLAIATVGNFYSQTISATGGADSPYTFTTADSLDGLALSKDGTLSGSPTTYGTFTFTVTATDGNNATGSQQYTLTVNPAIVVSPTSPTGLNIGTLNNAYSQQLSASGGAEGTYTFSTSSDLDGLNLSSTGLLSGNPGVAGSFPITVTATDSDGGTGSQDYTLVINQPIVVSPTSPTGLAIATLGNNYSQTISANGGAGGTYTFSSSSALDGLTLTSAGVLSGNRYRFGIVPHHRHVDGQ